MNYTFFSMIMPEMFLSLAILFCLIYNAFLITNKDLNYPIVSKEAFIQTFLILVCTLALCFNSVIEGYTFNHIIISLDGLQYLKIILIAISILILPSIFILFKTQQLNFFEYYILYLFSVLSSLILISTSNIMVVYLVIEMQALAFYIMACFNRSSNFSIEAGYKYFITGAFFSTLFLLGGSLIYGILGTLDLNYMYQLTLINLNDTFLTFLLVLGFSLILIVIFFKISIAPFHFWSIDVYDGSPLASTIIFSIIPKLPIFILLMKFLIVLETNFFFLIDIIAILGIFSFFTSSILTFKQKRFKKFLIYSSIPQISFLIISLSLEKTVDKEVLVNVLFFLIVYLISSILMWNLYTLFSEFKSFNKKTSSVSSFLSYFIGLYKLNKIYSLIALFILFSFSGIPLLVGFLSKFLVLFNLTSLKYCLLLIVIIFINCISVFYYLRLLKLSLFEIKYFSKIQVIIYKTPFFYIINFINLVLISFLVYTFFYPSFLIFVCQKCAASIMFV